MSSWIYALASQKTGEDYFRARLLEEERSKPQRLMALGEAWKLPIYPCTEIILPQESRFLKSACNRLTPNSLWELAVRLSRRDDGRILFRKVGVSGEQLRLAINRFCDVRDLVCLIAPYKVPAWSGTLIMRPDHVVMEVVRGAHTAISKGTASSTYLCNYALPSGSVKYSTLDTETRRVLYFFLGRTVKLLTGMSLREARGLGWPLYAEFHWHNDVGFRFIECSTSWVWTGRNRNDQVSQYVESPTSLVDLIAGVEKHS